MGDDGYDGMQAIDLGKTATMYIELGGESVDYIKYKSVAEDHDLDILDIDEYDVPDIRQVDISDESVWVTKDGIVIEWPAVSDSHLRAIINVIERGDKVFGQGFKINRARAEWLSRSSDLKSAIADLYDRVTE